MREIKFRIWDKYEKRMFYPDDISYICSIDNLHFSSTPIHKLDEIDYIETTDDVEIMQYTGIKDKNGRNVCEGDIIKLTNGDFCIVLFQDGAFMINFVKNGETGEVYPIDGKEVCHMTLDDISSFPRSSSLDRNINIETIGNIYENEELLKK